MSLVTQLLVAFGAPARRDEVAERLAARIGADSVVVFTPDASSRVLIPITRFSPPASAAAAWQEAIRLAAADEAGTTPILPDPGRGEPTRVVLRRCADGSVLAAVGGQPRTARLSWAMQIVPHLAAIVRAERASATLEEARRDASRARQERRDAETRAETASRLKDDFLATLSHELRTPLNALIGWVQMLRLYRHDDTIRERAIEVIERNARVQAQIVSDLLDVSRFVTGKLRLRLSPVDLGDVVRDACETVHPTMEARNLDLAIETAIVPGVVLGDADRMQQVVWNLVANAAKFTPAGGRISVRLGAADGVAVLTVADTGVGIQPELLPHVFERFWQSDSTITRAHGGLGLGLAIVRHLVELHGGTVDAASDGEHRGATFTVRFPYQQARSEKSSGLRQSDGARMMLASERDAGVHQTDVWAKQVDVERAREEQPVDARAHAQADVPLRSE